MCFFQLEAFVEILAHGVFISVLLDVGVGGVSGIFCVGGCIHDVGVSSGAKLRGVPSFTWFTEVVNGAV